MYFLIKFLSVYYTGVEYSACSVRQRSYNLSYTRVHVCVIKQAAVGSCIATTTDYSLYYNYDYNYSDYNYIHMYNCDLDEAKLFILFR